MTDKKCEELIADRMSGRLEDLLPDWNDSAVVCNLADEFGLNDPPVDIGSPDLSDDELDDLKHEIQEKHRDRVLGGVLSVDVRKSYRVLLSWGGPADGFDFVFNNEGDLIECEYFYQDWFDGAKRPVPIDQAEELAQLYCVGPEFE
jgi:hypothetical protein